MKQINNNTNINFLSSDTVDLDIYNNFNLTMGNISRQTSNSSW